MASTQSPARYIAPDALGLAESAALLRAGGLVSFPTETVYGLGANALNASAVTSIFTAKGRPLTDPLIVHVLDKESIYQLFDFGTADKHHLARQVCEALCEAFWPGPLTIIFKASSAIPPLVTANTGYVGLRAPRHIVSRRLLAAANLPIAAPSANRFGHVSPTSAAHVMADLHHVPGLLILQDEIGSGGCTVGIESTVCRVAEDGSSVDVLRSGAVTTDDIRTALAQRQLSSCVAVNIKNQRLLTQAPQGNTVAVVEETSQPSVAPGQLLKHYSPDIPTFILHHQQPAVSSMAVEKLFKSYSGSSGSIQHLSSAMVLDFGARLSHLKPLVAHYVDLSPTNDAAEACQTVFHHLRYAEGDDARHKGVSVLLLPDLTLTSAADEGVLALWERLNRAASGEMAKLL